MSAASSPAARAKKWGTNAFCAELLGNAAAYCQTANGKKEFEAWLVKEYGREEANEKLIECKEPPAYCSGPFANPYDKIFVEAAWDLGISTSALFEYQLFTGGSNLCTPPRTKPAPKRRRGESSIEWISRREDAAMTGCKIPDVDWRIARAIAMSEFDKARDTMEAWHTSPEIFFETVRTRASSVLVDSIYLKVQEGKKGDEILALDCAFRSCLQKITLSHMIWGQALELFEEFDRRGLLTTSAIERAYRSDSAFMWRLATCLCNVKFLARQLWEQFAEVISWSEYYRPFFIRRRLNSITTRIEVNRAYVKSLGGYPTGMDCTIVERLNQSFVGHGGFFENILMHMSKDPSEMKKFSPEAFREMGDLAIVYEFSDQMTQTAFGQTLIACVQSQDANCTADPRFLRNTTFMDPAKLNLAPRTHNDFAYVRTINRSVGGTWLHTINDVSMAQLFLHYKLPGANDSDEEKEAEALLYDMFWGSLDKELWRLASQLDWPGEARVGRMFGLYDPEDPERPTSLFPLFLRNLESRYAAVPELHSSKPASIFTPPETSSSTGAVSGYAYVNDLQRQSQTKEKIKTRRAEASNQAQEDTELEEEENLPESLPVDFKVGKKVLKVFHGILAAPDSPNSEHDAGRRLGQIRWEEFEKAMKRIGFSLFQTAGSSVRFDPPAKAARPITFHRPHPDSILTPIMLRWVGGRLKRCYGWTVETFGRGADD
ncbi:hypothetical protein C8F01DRAFT_1368173 [Mycena amicta]|nr:hypothetical protein C8F01DRAFT_1368173 [Mycena amicta]